jgi:hypothetical protein
MPPNPYPRKYPRRGRRSRKGDTLMFEEADLISGYSRSQALVDSVLIDVSVPASLMGFLYPVAITAGVYAEVTADTTNEAEARTQIDQVLLTLYQAIVDRPAGQDRLELTVELAPSRRLPLWSRCGPGDTPAPVLTVMLTDED